MSSSVRLARLSLAISAILVSSVVQADVVAHYAFNESSGATAAPTVGVINGVLQGAASFVAGGISGNAVSLVRSGDGVVNMGNNFGFLTGDYSISYWVQTTATEADTLALSKHSAGSQNGYLFPVGTTGGGGAPGKVNFTASTMVASGVTSTTTVNDGAWHHIVGVYQAGGNISIFVDGAPAEQIGTSSPMISNVSSFLVGGTGQIGSPLVADGRYTGLIDDLQIYNHALSDSHVNFLFANPGATVPEPTATVLIGIAALAPLVRRRPLRG